MRGLCMISTHFRACYGQVMEAAMQYAVLLMVVMLQMVYTRRTMLMRGAGFFRRARQMERRMGVILGMTVLAAMLCQEAVLWRCGLLSWRTGLPLHLCSMMGLLTLPMLLSGRDSLRTLCFYLGMPGALAALVFPAVLVTPWPGLTRLSFFVMHAGVASAPLVPLLTGWRPSPRGAVLAGMFLMLMAALAVWVNGLTGGNYLFLSLPVGGTPLAALANHGLLVYRLRLFAAAMAVLAVEGLAVKVVWHRQGTGRRVLYSPSSE